MTKNQPTPSDFNRPPIVPRLCSIEGCSKPRKGRGWCGAHYMRWMRWGDPLGTPPPKPPRVVPSQAEVVAEMHEVLARLREEVGA